MIKNKNLLFCCILSVLVVSSVQAEDAQAKKLALEIIASLSDDLATLIINKKTQKDPQVTKICCVRLIANLADALASVIIKIKSNKEVRGIDLSDEQDYQKALANISDQLVSKIESEA